MSNSQVKTILGALVAIGLVIAVAYGLISQQTADKIQTQVNQSLSNGQTTPSPNGTPQQPASVPASPAPTPSASTPPSAPAGNSPAPAQK